MRFILKMYLIRLINLIVWKQHFKPQLFLCLSSILVCLLKSSRIKTIKDNNPDTFLPAKSDRLS